MGKFFGYGIFGSEQVAGGVLGDRGFFGPTIKLTAAAPPSGITITGANLQTGNHVLTFTPVGFQVNGETLISITSRVSNGNLTITVAGTVAQNFFTAITFSNNIFGALSYTTASASSFGPIGANSNWVWAGQTFNAGNVGGTAAFT